MKEKGMKKAIVRQRIMLRRAIRKVKRFNDKVCDLELAHPFASAMIVVMVVPAMGLLLGRPNSVRDLVIFLGSFLGGGFVAGAMLFCGLKWVAKDKCLAKQRRRICNRVAYIVCAVLYGCLLVIFAILKLGGVDEPPTSFPDLIVADGNCECDDGDNAYVALTNLAGRIKAEEDRVGELSVWDNAESNRLWLAMYDAAASCKEYVPMSLSECVKWYEADGGLALLPLVGLNETNLSARIMSAARQGHCDKAIKWFLQDIRTGLRIRKNCGTFYDYLIARWFIENSIENIRKAIDEHGFSDLQLKEIDEALLSLGVGERKDLLNAMKREYTVNGMKYESWTSRVAKREVVDRMLYRYFYHPNAMLRIEGCVIKELMNDFEYGIEVKDGGHMTKWYRSFIPNGWGRESVENWCDMYRKAARRIQLTTPLYYQIASRIHVASVRYKLKYGKRPERCADIVEFMGDVPQKLMGRDVKVDFENGVVRCGDISEELWNNEKND